MTSQTKTAVLFLVIAMLCVGFFSTRSQIINSPKQTSPTPTPVPDTAPISVFDAPRFSGHIKTVRMTAAYVSYDRGKEIFISSRKNPHHAHMLPPKADKRGFLTLSIKEKYLSGFPPKYADTLRGQEIEVTGELTWYQGDPHIIVTVPRQILLPTPTLDTPLLIGL